MPLDVTVSNYQRYLGVCGDGLNPIIFDTSGKITDDLFGSGANNSVLGFAGPDCATAVPPVISEGSAVLNGKWVDGISSATNPEMLVDEFDAVLTHEFGHYVNLDHSQIGLQEASDLVTSNDNAIATMFPILINASEQRTLSLDDEVSVSTLYPTESFASSYGTISGSIFLANGVTPFQGAYVIARNLADPRLTAVGVASGARFFPTRAGGPPAPALEGLYEIPGLPPGTYSLEIEAIAASFTDGSSVGPLNPPAPLPGPPEFWNGADEGNSDASDDPTDFVPFTVNAHATASGTNIILNARQSPANDQCGSPTVVTALPFADTMDTTAATSSASDPLQSCTFGFPASNARSVWYSFTAPADGILAVDTFGSSYDTVVTAHSGTCGALAEIACNDDAAAGRLSEIALAVAAGQTVLIEVTQFFGAPGGGTLNVHADFICGGPVAVDTPKIVITRLHSRSGDARLTFSGTLTLPYPFTPAVTPSATGMLVLIEDMAGGVLNVTIPGGAFGYTAGMGWRANRARTKWTYSNRTHQPPGGIRRIVIQDQSKVMPGRLKFTVRGRAGSYPVVSSHLPLTGMIVLDGLAAQRCGELSFPGPGPAPCCTMSVAATKLTCR